MMNINREKNNLCLELPVDDARNSYVFQHPAIKLMKQKYATRSMCTVLVLTNLAEPQLVAIPCFLKLGQAVYCVPHTKSATLIGATSVLDLYFCAQNFFIQINASCFEFQWNGKATDISKLLSATLVTNTSILQAVFQAVSCNFLPVFSPQLTHIIKFSRCSSRFKETFTPISRKGEAFIITEHKTKNFHIFGTMFLCLKGSIVSLMSLCDGKIDCPANDTSDEEGCSCKKSEHYTSKCKFLRHNDKKECSVFYFLSRSKSCQFYFHKQNSQKCTLVRSNTTCTSSVIQVDANSANLVENNCAKNGKLSCQNENRCYEVHQICVYKLDTCRFLTPCKQGGHMEDCKQFTCNAMFKCPNFYCIPWQNICDGRWDCPQGLDETLNQCPRSRECRFLYKCQGSGVCLHLMSICDGACDCPAKDDEFSCALKDAKCPDVCSCLVFAIHCKNTLLFWTQLELIFFFHAIFMQNVTFSAMYPNPKNILILDVKYSIFPQWCVLSCKMISVLHIILRNNSLETVEESCFSQAVSVKLIRLDENKISYIQHDVFPESANLTCLNLSANPIVSLEPCVLKSLSMVTVLSVHNFSLLEVDENPLDSTLIVILDTDSYVLCCFSSVGTKCTQHLPWFVSCFHLLHSEGVGIAFWTVSALIFSLALLSMVMQMRSHRMGLEKTGAYGLQVASVNTLDISFSLCHFTFATADFHHRDVFAAHADKWKSSTLCFTLHTILFSYSVLSPVLLCFMSLSRLMVVVHPVDSDFKRTSFVRKYVISFIVVICVLATATTVLLWGIAGKVPNALCMPFSDPLDSVVLVQILAWIMLLLKSFAVVGIAVMYGILVKELKKSQNKVKEGRSKQTSNVPLYCQLICMVIVDFLCWVPSGIVYIVALLMEQYTPTVIAYTFLTGETLNSIVNPTIFTVLTVRKQGN